jgi:hypothetical protein
MPIDKNGKCRGLSVLTNGEGGKYLKNTTMEYTKLFFCVIYLPKFCVFKLKYMSPRKCITLYASVFLSYLFRCALLDYSFYYVLNFRLRLQI